MCVKVIQNQDVRDKISTLLSVQTFIPSITPKIHTDEKAPSLHYHPSYIENAGKCTQSLHCQHSSTTDSDKPKKCMEMTRGEKHEPLSRIFSRKDCTIENFKNCSPEKTVRFSDIEVRYYPIILGDNPGGRTCGPPLTIDWEHVGETVIPLEKFESRRKPRRNEDQLLMTPLRRRRILLQENSEEEIKKEMKEVLKIRKQRSRTVQMSLGCFMAQRWKCLLGHFKKSNSRCT